MHLFSARLREAFLSHKCNWLLRGVSDYSSHVYETHVTLNEVKSSSCCPLVDILRNKITFCRPSVDVRWWYREGMDGCDRKGSKGERERTTGSERTSEAEQMCVYIHLTSFEANLHKVFRLRRQLESARRLTASQCIFAVAELYELAKIREKEPAEWVREMREKHNTEWSIHWPQVSSLSLARSLYSIPFIIFLFS